MSFMYNLPVDAYVHESVCFPNSPLFIIETSFTEVIYILCLLLYTECLGD